MKTERESERENDCIQSHTHCRDRKRKRRRRNDWFVRSQIDETGIYIYIEYIT